MHRLIRRNVPLLQYVLADLRKLAEHPGPTSFFSRAFYACRPIASAVAKTPYLQSMREGTLDPLDYGRLMVQDAYYCYHAQDTLKSLAERVDQETYPGLYDLITSQVESYDNYNRTFLEDWRIRNTESVIPTDTMRSYVEHEQRVAREEDPIYTLVVYLPCYHLWPWFARRLMMSPHYHPGVYQSWFEGIYEGEIDSFGSAWMFGNFIEQWKDVGRPFDEDRAFGLYRTSMEFELALFSEASS